MNKNSKQNFQVFWEQNKLLRSNQGRREKGAGGGDANPPTISWCKNFFSTLNGKAYNFRKTFTFE